MSLSNQTSRRPRRADLILILGFLLLAAVLLCVRCMTRKEGGYISVSVDGEVIGEYSLLTDTELCLESADGGYNLLVIKDGCASITDANCPDKLCVHQKSIRYNGETIVCLPHKIVITVSGSASKEAVL